MMQFEIVAALFAIFAIIFLYAGYKLLASSGWLGGWLRGNLGILCVLLTGAFILCVLDVRTYKPMFDDKTVATLSFREIKAQHYEVRLVDALGIENRYSVVGNNWSLTANQFRWSKRLSLGMGHGYRFTAITGSSATATDVVSGDVLSQSHYFDFWKFINKYAPSNFLVSTDVIVTPPQPLADAAMYEVVPLGFDLVVKPLNELAKRAQQVTEQVMEPPADAAQLNSEDASAAATESVPVAKSISAPAAPVVVAPVAESVSIPAPQEKSATAPQ